MHKSFGKNSGAGNLNIKISPNNKIDLSKTKKETKDVKQKDIEFHNSITRPKGNSSVKARGKFSEKLQDWALSLKELFNDF